MAATVALDPQAAPDVRLMNMTAQLLVVVGSVLLLAVLLLWVARQPVFALRTIRIEGDVTRNSVSTIRANAAPQLAGNFFTLDLARAQAAFQSVPWVRQAVVMRRWPNRLVVRLEEHRATALWNNDSGDDKLVNSFGEVFEANLGDVEDDALPTLKGPEGSSVQMLGMWRRLGPVFALLDARVETLALSSRGSWRAELDTGAEVELGRGSEDEVVERGQRFVSTVTQVTQRYQRPLEYADLRHNEGYAVRLKGISTTFENNDKTTRK
jgi:cell division protein FtsQ